MKVSGSKLARINRSSPLYQELLDVHLKISKKDATTWGAAAAEEAAIRLNWVDLPDSSTELVPQLTDVAQQFSRFSRVVLCGMGGSSLGPEVIARSYNRDLFIFDSTDPEYAKAALSGKLDDTVVIVSSKSGSTIEIASQRAIFESAFHSAGIDPTHHMVFVTDPGSPLDSDARSAGYLVVNADPNVGGRFSVLSAFGLTPAAIIGVDIEELLAGAQSEKRDLLNNPQQVIDIAYSFAVESEQYITFTDEGSPWPGLSDWIEQLVAESTGKNETGRLPIATKSLANASIGEALTVTFVDSGADIVVEGSLGGHFLFWEWVTALLGYALKIDPFNQPNVTEAKEQTAACLQEWNNQLPKLQPDLVEESVEIFGQGQSLHDALAIFIEGVANGGYISVMAYLNRLEDDRLIEIRDILSEKAQRPTQFGWGPRFLHSTGQFHKGGQRNGSFLQITGDTSLDYQIPTKPFSLRTLFMAQAIGDNRTLALRHFPVLRLHLTDRRTGIDQVLAAARALN